jgi:hypothetical protein
VNWGRSGRRNGERGKLAQLCVHLSSHGDGDAAATNPTAVSRGGGEACGQVAAAVVISDGEGSHCHSHIAAEVPKPAGVHPNPVYEPLAALAGDGTGRWAKSNVRFTWVSP